MSDPTVSHVLVLEVAVDTIVSELEMILDVELDSHSDAVEMLDAHNLSHLFAALSEAEKALIGICANGVLGSNEALTSFRKFAKNLGQADGEKIRELFLEINPQEHLEGDVLISIADYRVSP